MIHKVIQSFVKNRNKGQIWKILCPYIVTMTVQISIFHTTHRTAIIIKSVKDTDGCYLITNHKLII